MREDIKKRIASKKNNAVLDGYVKTRAGLMPEDWTPIRLAKNIFKNYSNKKQDGTLPVLSASQERGIVLRDEIEIDIKYSRDNINSYKKVEPGDFVISLRSFQGGIEYSEIAGLVSPAYTVLKPRMPIADGYYKNYFKTHDMISRLNATLYGIRDGKQIGFEDFGELVLHYPPMEEQQKIAEILNHCDKVIELKQQLIEEERNRKKWLIQNLFDSDSGVRLPGFNGEWKLVKIGSCLKIMHGKDQKQIECADGKYPILASGGEIGKTNTPIYDKPSVLIGRKGTIDKPMYKDAPFWTVDTLFYSKVKDAMVPQFLYFVFCRINWHKYEESTGVPSLSAKSIENILVTIPPTVEEQKAIVEILASCDNTIALLEQELTQWQQKKKSLMQLLLTGLVRVTV